MDAAEAINRVRAADDEAHAAQLAFTLGPDVFLSRLQSQAELLRKKLEAEYVAANDAGKDR